jgi:hypothetical protein
MKFRPERPFASPEAAEKRLLELANAVKADHAGRLSVAVINKQFRDAGGSYEDFYETGRYAAQYSSDAVRIR